MADEGGDVDVASTAEEEAPPPQSSPPMEPPPHLARVRRDVLAACMTCPLCHKLLRDATTISECLHTFCRKCIYKKLNDEEVECCPICNTDLGCVPLEKLRPDHNLQDLRAKIFPFKRRKVEAPEVASSLTLPVRRKERSLSSLVVNTPRVAKRTSFTGRRTRAVPRRAASLRKRSPVIEESAEKEDAGVKGGAVSSSPETLSKMIHGKRHNLSNGEPSNRASKKDSENGRECFSDKSELWKPLTCLVEAANRTKPLKSSPQSTIMKSEEAGSPDSDLPAYIIRENPDKAKVEDGKNGSLSVKAVQAKAKRKNGISRKRRGRGTMAQALVDAASAKREKRTGPIWLSLVASFDQEGDVPLPQIPSCYLRIKDGNLLVSFIQKYLVNKLNLPNETEVELTCRGEAVSPTITMHSLVDLWLHSGSLERVQASVGTSAKDFIMVLSYARRAPALQ